MKKRRVATEMWFFIWLQMGTRKTHILKNRKKQLKFMGHFIRKDGLENLIYTERIEGSRVRAKQRANYRMSLCEWMTAGTLRVDKGSNFI